MEELPDELLVEILKHVTRWKSYLRQIMWRIRFVSRKWNRLVWRSVEDVRFAASPIPLLDDSELEPLRALKNPSDFPQKLFPRVEHGMELLMKNIERERVTRIEFFPFPKESRVDVRGFVLACLNVESLVLFDPVQKGKITWNDLFELRKLKSYEGPLLFGNFDVSRLTHLSSLAITGPLLFSDDPNSKWGPVRRYFELFTNLTSLTIKAPVNVTDFVHLKSLSLQFETTDDAWANLANFKGTSLRELGVDIERITESGTPRSLLPWMKLLQKLEMRNECFLGEQLGELIELRDLRLHQINPALLSHVRPDHLQTLFVSCSRLVEVEWIELLGRLKSLVDLEIQGRLLAPTFLDPVLRNLTRLKRLHLEDSGRGLRQGVKEIISPFFNLDKLSDLRDLSLLNYRIEEIRPGDLPTSLTRLSLSSLSDTDVLDQVYLTPLRKYTNLMSLSLSVLSRAKRRLSKSALLDLTNTLIKLESLELHLLWPLDNKVDEKFALLHLNQIDSVEISPYPYNM